MDFDSMSRRDLRLLCKKNGLKAPAVNLPNAAIADALRKLPSVIGKDELGLDPAKGGSPLPRSRRVSAGSPSAHCNEEEIPPKKSFRRRKRELKSQVRRALMATEDGTAGVVSQSKSPTAAERGAGDATPRKLRRVSSILRQLDDKDETRGPPDAATTLPLASN